MKSEIKVSLCVSKVSLCFEGFITGEIVRDAFSPNRVFEFFLGFESTNSDAVRLGFWKCFLIRVVVVVEWILFVDVSVLHV